jgi:hypothetical protein
MNNKFNKVFVNGEELDGFQIIDPNWSKDGVCRRCGQSFIKKYKEQTFCSRNCVSIYKKKRNAMMGNYDQEFSDWWDNLFEPIDTSKIIGYDEWEKRF